MNSALQSGSLPHGSPATGHGPLTPVFATLTSRPQLTENPTTLSPFLATHTDSPFPNSFPCHSYENNRGVYQLFPKWNAPAPPERNCHESQNHQHRHCLDSASLSASFSQSAILPSAHRRPRLWPLLQTCGRAPQGPRPSRPCCLPHRRPRGIPLCCRYQPLPRQTL